MWGVPVPAVVVPNLGRGSADDRRVCRDRLCGCISAEVADFLYRWSGTRIRSRYANRARRTNDYNLVSVPTGEFFHPVEIDMAAEREIRANYDRDTIAVYQTYSPAIADAALAADRFSALR